jgi:predicted outer membrane protein
MRCAERHALRRAAELAAAWLLLVGLPAIALAADPTTTPGAAAGDPRSSGQGPGLVGNPGWAIAIVAVIGVTAVLATLGYVRLTRERDRPDGS